MQERQAQLQRTGGDTVAYILEGGLGVRAGVGGWVGAAPAAAAAAAGGLVGEHCVVAGLVCQIPGWRHEAHTWLSESPAHPGFSTKRTICMAST